MRFHFPNSERPDFSWIDGRVSIGSDAACGLRVAVGSVAPHHADITVSPIRGIELNVQPGAEVHVNGRAVIERAVVRLGDVLLLGNVSILLRGDSDRREAPPQASDDLYKSLAPKASLRAVSGQHFGRIIALKARTTIGRGSECDIVLNDPAMSRQHAALENTASGVFLRDLGSANGTFVNGALVCDAILKSGDQIAFDVHRFILEVTGLSPLDFIVRPSPTQVLARQSEANASGGYLAQSAHQPTASGSPPLPPPAPSTDPESDAAFWANAMIILACLCAIGMLIYYFFWNKH
jgi:pSer/pThr/pTyr-binding forkhead associated (FHA) protein